MAKYSRIVKGAGVGRAGINIARRGAVKAATGQGTVIASNAGSQFFKNMDNYIQKMAKSGLGKSFDNQTGLISFTQGVKNANSETIGKRINQGAMKAGYITRNAAGEITDVNYSKIAKGYMAASAAARVATGGGLYKDNQGNTNVVGIPFI